MRPKSPIDFFYWTLNYLFTCPHHPSWIIVDELPKLWVAVSFPDGSDGKASACNVGDPGSIPGLGRSPGEGNGNPLQLLPGKSHGWRSLIGYSPWGCKESDTTEWLHFRFLPLPLLRRNKAPHLPRKSPVGRTSGKEGQWCWCSWSHIGEHPLLSSGAGSLRKSFTLHSPLLRGTYFCLPHMEIKLFQKVLILFA